MEGLHILASFYGCKNKKLLVDKNYLKRKLIYFVKKSGFNVVGECFYKFGRNEGITGVVLISESHVSVHTWPEKDNSLTLDVYACNVKQNNERKTIALFELLKDLFHPKKIKKKVLRR